MREMKFRIWSESEQRYVYGLSRYLFGSDDNEKCTLYIPQDFKAVFEQYTGLKDKNGREIYENDIVSEEFEYGGEKTKTIWQVRWCDDECAFELHYVSGFEVDDCSLDAEEDYEVIGNIHQNKELLE